MERFFNNLINLFSDDNQVMYRALLEKKDWILSKFYIIATLENDCDFEDIIEGRIRFKKVLIDPNIFTDKELYKECDSLFLNQYRCLYLYNQIPDVESDEDFIICFDFNYVDNESYKILFPNFYPCFYRDYLIKSTGIKEADILKGAMDKALGDNVIILSNDNLDNSTFKCNVVSEIIVPNTLKSGYKTALSLLCSKLDIKYRG